MAVSNIKAVFQSDIQSVWEVVTSLGDYSWRSDLSKIEVISENQFTEYTKEGYATVFTVTAKEPCRRWEFDMENSNMKGHWTGIFTKKDSHTEIDFTEEVVAKKVIMKPFVKAYLKKQQEIYISDLRKALKFQYRKLYADEICRELFKDFIRHQKVTKCWRKENNEWIIKDAPFIDDWTEADYQTLVSCLKNTAATGGLVYAAFYDGMLKGFVSVEAALFGGEQKYLDLSSIHVSEDMRGRGIGKKLFLAAKKWAKENGADKLYISAHSAVESQAFYKKMGCVEAQVYNQKHVEAEPYDCQLECKCNVG